MGNSLYGFSVSEPFSGNLIGYGKNRRRWLIFRFGGDETPETSSRLPPLLVAVSAPLALSRTALIVAPARVTDTLDSTRNERFHRRHLRHRYVTPASHLPRVAPRRRPPASAHVVPSDRIYALSPGFIPSPSGRAARALRHRWSRPRRSPTRRSTRQSSTTPNPDAFASKANATRTARALIREPSLDPGRSKTGIARHRARSVLAADRR